jgi:hypothetical protein
MNKITAAHLARRACVYIRQSMPGQVQHNLESQRRQYNLVDRARALGWQEVEGAKLQQIKQQLRKRMHDPVRGMAQIGRAGILQLLCGNRKPRQPQRVPRTGESLLAPDVTPSQPETPTQLGENAQAD